MATKMKKKAKLTPEQREELQAKRAQRARDEALEAEPEVVDSTAEEEAPDDELKRPPDKTPGMLVPQHVFTEEQREEITKEAHTQIMKILKGATQTLDKAQIALHYTELVSRVHRPYW